MAERPTPRRHRRKLTAHEIDRFVRALAETGNFTLAAERIGRHDTTLIKRRQRTPLFAAQCAAAIAEFRLAAAAPDGGLRGLRRQPSWRRGGYKHERGELILVHGRKRPAQIRRAGGGELTQAGLDAFLATLAATANVRLSAGCVGVRPNAIRQRRLRAESFDQAVRAARLAGFDRLEAAVISSALRAFGDGAGDGEAEPLAELPAMRVDDALMLFFHLRRTCRDGWESRRRPVRSASHSDIIAALERRLRNWRPPEE